jgi:YD repeat-containing protein
MGRRIKRILPGGQVETYSYNLAGNLVSRTDFNGKVTTYQYDALNRLIQITPDPSLNEPPITLTYTVTGRRQYTN